MRNEKIYKIIFLMLIALSLGACSNRESTTEESTAKEIFLKSEYTEVTDDISGMSHYCYDGDGWYAVAAEKTGEDIPQSVIDKAAKEKTEVENDGRYDVYSRTLWHISADGKLKQLKRYTPLEEEENTDNWKNFSSVSNFGAMTADGSGNLISLEYNYLSGSSAPDKAADYVAGKNYNEFKTVWYLRILDASTGRVKETHQLETEDNCFFTADAMLYDNGYVLLAEETDVKSRILMFSSEGKLEKTLDCEEKGIQLFQLNDGTPAYYGYGVSGVAVKEIDTGKVELRNVAASEDKIDQICCGFGDYTFCYGSGWKLYGYSAEQGNDQYLLSWSEIGVDTENIVSGIRTDAEGRLVFIDSAYKDAGGVKTAVIIKLAEDNSADAAEVQKTETEAETETPIAPTELILLTCDPSDHLQTLVADFNSESSDYVIKIADFSPYCGDFSSASVKAAMESYVQEKLDGKCPDILDLSYLPYRMLAARGDLQNLYELMDTDPEIKKENLVSGLLNALEVEGKLCASCSGFTIDTLLAPADAAGDGSGWSIDEYNAALQKMGSGCTAFDVFITSEDILKEYIRISFDEFIDWENGTCSFDSDAFKTILNFAASFPEQFNSSSYNWENGSTNSDLRINRGEQMLLKTCIFNMRDALRSGYEFSGEIAYKGYPAAYGNGSVFNLSSPDMPPNFAILSGSGNKDGAWKFVRMFFSADYQKNSSFFPSNLSLFNKQLEQAMKIVYVVDSEGKPVIGKKTGEPVECSKETMYLSDFTAVKCYAMRQEKADKLANLIENTRAVSFHSDELEDLIFYAAKEVLSGKVSADTAAANVQNVVSTYLNNLYGISSIPADETD